MARFPRALLVIALITYVVLMLLFRSLVLPLKAILMNMLSILASYGALVFIFQQGHLSQLLELHAARLRRGVGADPDVLRALRPLDGLRGLPALAHPRGV